MMIVHAEPPRPDGSRSLRLAPAAGRGRQVPPEGRHHPRPRPIASSSQLAPFVVLISTFLLVRRRSGRPRRRSRRPRHRHLLRPGGVVDVGASASSWPAGRRPTSTRCSVACGPPASSSPTSCPWCSRWSAWSSRPARSTCRASSSPRPSGEIFGWGGIGNPFILTQFVGFFIFMIAMQAELTQPPFDMPVAESELVAGYMTEYTGHPVPVLLHRRVRHRRSSFAAIAAVLFLGGWWRAGHRLARPTG